uniref:mannose-6-phosphate isomerase n=1 Tax=Syphacia muris TaxID=451379 RepID=A0A0N5AKN8_9BILA
MVLEKLRCAVQCYDWGVYGNKSLVARLMECGNANFRSDPNKPYAEVGIYRYLLKLWMGVHKNGPSVIQSTNQPLQGYINEHPEVIADHENGTIQFLFKVLSVNKALSIQTHPTKERASELHAKDPKHYPDTNHKPEMVIALGNFEMLCGFRPANEIIENIESYSEFRSLLKDDIAVDELKNSDEETRKSALKRLFKMYMTAAPEEVLNACAAMTKRIKKRFITQEKSEESHHLFTENLCSKLDNLIIRLNTEFPGDVGVFAPLLLNYYSLKSGESVFLGSNIPHAYLNGDCIECMACSDNTIRAGLTPKFKDVDTLCSDLNYTMSTPPHFNPSPCGSSMTLYSPSVQEFAVMGIQASYTNALISTSRTKASIHHNAKVLEEVRASSIMIVISGSASLQFHKEEVKLSKGDVVFISADSPKLPLMTSDDFVAYRAYTPRQQH